ncbi:hypothetical protein SD235_11425 [Burkholderia cepacia]|uniref:hypothetical protein n=1 Tax=Burkholderia cepacia TaxID=292 RepID=UPI003A4D3300
MTTTYPQTGTNSANRDGSFASQAHPTAGGTATAPAKAFQNECYATEVIDGTPERFDAIEIQGVREEIDLIDPAKSCCEVDNRTPQFFSIYLHEVEGGVACVADLATYELAVAYAEQLADRYDWAIYDYYLTNV